jgi:hypothetical protein
VTLGVALFLVLGGPAPGSVGDCTSESAVANPEEHCIQVESWICARMDARGELAAMSPPMTVRQCVDTNTATCSGATWQTGCTPTRMASTHCINALQEGSRLFEPDRGFPECDLCSGMSPLTEAPPPAYETEIDPDLLYVPPDLDFEVPVFEEAP